MSKIVQNPRKYIWDKALPERVSLSEIMIGVTLLTNNAAAKINNY